MDNVKLILFLFFISTSLFGAVAPVGFPQASFLNVTSQALADRTIFTMTLPAVSVDNLYVTRSLGQSITNQVGVLFDTNNFYYAGIVDLVVDGKTIPVTVGSPLDFDSIALNMVDAVNISNTQAFNEYNLSLSERVLNKIIKPSEAILPLLISTGTVITVAVSVLQIAGFAYDFFNKNWNKSIISSIDAVGWCVSSCSYSGQSKSEACQSWGAAYGMWGGYYNGVGCSYNGGGYVRNDQVPYLLPDVSHCPVNSVYNSVTTKCDYQASLIPVTDNEVKTGLSSFLKSAAQTVGGVLGVGGALYTLRDQACAGGKICKIVAGVAALSGAIDLTKGISGMVEAGKVPDIVPATTLKPLVKGDSFIPISQKVTTTPDGAQVKNKEDLKVIYDSPANGQVTVQRQATITNTTPAGVSTVASTSLSAPIIPYVSPSNSSGSSSDICLKDPTILACQHLNNTAVLTTDLIKTKSVTIDFNPSNELGSCPAPYQMSLILVGQKELSFELFCSFLEKSRYILIALGYLLAGYTVLDAVKV